MRNKITKMLAGSVLLTGIVLSTAFVANASVGYFTLAKTSTVVKATLKNNQSTTRYECLAEKIYDPEGNLLSPYNTYNKGKVSPSSSLSVSITYPSTAYSARAICDIHATDSKDSSVANTFNQTISLR